MAVKTLHPKIHAGILDGEILPEHVATCNSTIYPTLICCGESVPICGHHRQTGLHAGRRGRKHRHWRADHGARCSKKLSFRAIVTDPADYGDLLVQLQANHAALSHTHTICSGQKKAFSHTAAYDSAISNYLTALDADGTNTKFPAQINFNFAKVQDLRYGRNPHQHAAFYRDINGVVAALPVTRNYKAKNCPTTISPMQMRPGNWLKHLSNVPASSSTCQPCGVAIAERHWRLIVWHLPLIPLCIWWHHCVQSHGRRGWR